MSPPAPMHPSAGAWTCSAPGGSKLTPGRARWRRGRRCRVEHLRGRALRIEPSCVNPVSEHSGAADATAFAYPDAKFAPVIAGMWPNPADNEANIRWVLDYHRALEPHTSKGGYIKTHGRGRRWLYPRQLRCQLRPPGFDQEDLRPGQPSPDQPEHRPGAGLARRPARLAPSLTRLAPVPTTHRMRKRAAPLPVKLSWVRA